MKCHQKWERGAEKNKKNAHFACPLPLSRRNLAVGLIGRKRTISRLSVYKLYARQSYRHIFIYDVQPLSANSVSHSNTPGHMDNQRRYSAHMREVREMPRKNTGLFSNFYSGRPIPKEIEKDMNFSRLYLR